MNQFISTHIGKTHRFILAAQFVVPKLMRSFSSMFAMIQSLAWRQRHLRNQRWAEAGELSSD